MSNGVGLIMVKVGVYIDNIMNIMTSLGAFKVLL